MKFKPQDIANRILSAVQELPRTEKQIAQIVGIPIKDVWGYIEINDMPIMFVDGKWRMKPVQNKPIVERRKALIRTPVTNGIGGSNAR